MGSSWPLPDRLSPAASGVRAQWLGRHDSFPPLLAVLSVAPHWLLAVCQARALARGDRAREVFEMFEAEVAAATGHSAVVWPPAWGVVVTRFPAFPKAEEPDLARLDPSHALMVGRGAMVSHLPTARTIGALVEAAFSRRSPDRRVGDEARARMLSTCLPDHLAPRWRAGLGLEPPSVLVPDAVRDARRLLQGLPARAPIPLADYEALAPAEVLDLVCTEAAVRTSLLAAEGQQPSPMAA